MSQTLIIRGGKPLHGEVTLSGAKNAATKLMIASLLTDEPVILENCPQLGDVHITAEICRQVGSSVEFTSKGARLHTPNITQTVVKKLTRSNRISVLTLSPLLHRTGVAEVPVVGGDKIGPRPVNFHIEALRQMGATIKETDQGYRAEAKSLIGAALRLDYPSVGATETIIFAAVLAKGRTTISNAATEPEILDLIKMLQQMGAIIELGAGRTITIDGVERLGGVTYRVMPDRLEAASFALMAVATDGEILVRGARQDDLVTFLNTLRRIGATYQITDEGIRFKRAGKLLSGIELETDTHPGFATDWQQPLVVLLTQSNGLSVVHETVYEDRFGYTDDLRRMGADIQVFSKCLGELPCRFKGEQHPHSAIISGPTALHSATVAIPDIRAGMAHVVAGAIASGDTKLTGVEELTRGYENLLEKLESVGLEFTVE